ncbi:hypothetical protein QBC46DRAFT_356337 [Diplogelasinospora grovesii]|uniref:Uncharacterized protein n=1 Tax=Diplogelasinospora grovesii TaxID=303347 RepID=A0AAN6N278_9PEZI|nr:hypothetical protein QBC46DRAFT_356337 [Diplogelasinospora grovesii]
MDLRYDDPMMDESAPLIPAISASASDVGLFTIPLQRPPPQPTFSHAPPPGEIVTSPVVSAETTGCSSSPRPQSSDPFFNNSSEEEEDAVHISPPSSFYNSPDLNNTIEEDGGGKLTLALLSSPHPAPHDFVSPAQLHIHPPPPPPPDQVVHLQQQFFHNDTPEGSEEQDDDDLEDRVSQLRATPDSAYDRARSMELHRSEWKRVVYRFPVKGKAHWVVDADLTESSHARLSDVARRSAEGFESSGEYELANIYRVLCKVHRRLMEEMRAERCSYDI